MRILFNLFIVLIISLYCTQILARTRVAVLAFELNDITSLPNTPDELSRTNSLKPLLEQALIQNAALEIVTINKEEQSFANAGFGYLFRFPDETAKLGKRHSADWIIIGQHSKPSFLESSLIVDVVRTADAKRIAELIIDLKGNHEKVTERAAKALANKIILVLSPGKK